MSLKTEKIQKFLQILIAFMIALIPLAWSTRVNANYYTTKTFLLYFVGGLSSIYLLLHSQSYLTSMKNSFRNGLRLVVLAQLLLLVIAPWPHGFFYIGKFLAFVSLVYYLEAIQFSLSDFLSRYSKIVACFAAGLIGLTGFNLYQSLTGADPFLSTMLLKPFGNVNMLAEFYILALPFMYYWLRGTRSDFYLQTLKWFFFLSLNVFIVTSQSRSAYLGLALWWLWLAYETFLKNLSTKLKLIAAFFIIIFGLIFIVPKLNTYFAAKSVSTSERSNFYQSAMDLIQSHPWGIGHGYLNDIVPYRLNYPAGGPSELDYPDQPHSEILKWGVQFGWLGLLCALAVLLVLARRIFASQDFLFKGLYSVLIPQLFFQFPFENPASIILLALMVYLTAQNFDLPLLDFKWPNSVGFSRLVVGTTAVILMSISYGFLKSIYLESNYADNAEKTQLACDLNPNNLRACIRKNYNILALGDYPRLIQSLKKDTQLNYYSADYLKMLNQLVQVKKQSSSLEKSCQIAQVYAFIYKGQNYFPQEDLLLCQPVAMPVVYIEPEQFDRDYKIWYQKLLNDLDQDLK